MNRKGDYFDSNLIILAIFTLLSLVLITGVIMSFIGTFNIQEACDNFGGKIVGDNQCFKNGSFYTVKLDGWGNKVYIGRLAVDAEVHE